jgi:hypothetical protein
MRGSPWVRYELPEALKPFMRQNPYQPQPLQITALDL